MVSEKKYLNHKFLKESIPTNPYKNAYFIPINYKEQSFFDLLFLELNNDLLDIGY